MKKELESLCDTIGYQFKNIDLLDQALTHRSMGKKNNERLEFLGDSVLSFIISQALFNQYPKAREGELTRLRSTLVRGETLAEIAQEFELGKHIRLGVGEMKSGGHRRESILSDTVEAIISAIYLDSDITQVKKIVLQWFEERLDSIDPTKLHKDPKTQLQEYLQAKQLALPEYHVTAIEGEQHAQTFTVECRIQGHEEVTIGISNSRRRAEQEAAKQFLQRLIHHGK